LKLNTVEMFPSHLFLHCSGQSAYATDIAYLSQLSFPKMWSKFISLGIRKIEEEKIKRIEVPAPLTWGTMALSIYLIASHVT